MSHTHTHTHTHTYTHIFCLFYYFCSFFSFFAWKMLKSRFWSAFGVISTQTLVEIRYRRNNVSSAQATVNKNSSFRNRHSNIGHSGLCYSGKVYDMLYHNFRFSVDSWSIGLNPGLGFTLINSAVGCIKSLPKMDYLQKSVYTVIDNADELQK